jgi:hypothetical protein
VATVLPSRSPRLATTGNAANRPSAFSTLAVMRPRLWGKICATLLCAAFHPKTRNVLVTTLLNTKL